MANGTHEPQQRGKAAGGRGLQRGAQGPHPQALANGVHHRNSSGQIAAVHAIGYGPGKLVQEQSLGQLSSTDLERRKQTLAGECATMQAVRSVALFWTMLFEVLLGVVWQQAVRHLVL